jgi:hypothetical protein
MRTLLPRFRHHCCPVCENYVGLRRLWRSRPFHGEWQCPSCHTWLEIDYSSRILVGFCAAIWGAFLIFHVHSALLAAALFALGALIFSELLSVCVAQKPRRPKEEQDSREAPKT